MMPSPPALEIPVPVADHVVCMTCGCHVQHGMLKIHYAVLHPDADWPAARPAVTTGALDDE